MTIEYQFEQRNIQNIIRYNRKVQAVLNQASNDLAMKIAIFEMKNPTKIAQGSFYRINKGLANKIDVILGKLRKDIGANISEGIVSSWDMANLKNNKLVDIWAEGIKLSEDSILTSFNQLNLTAMETFLTKTAAKMNLSQRVWNLVSGVKDQIELYLASGISTGKSASEIAREIKQYLNEPDRLFRRVRQDGKLVLSKAAKGYHPGAGIYRSSFKNALRLAKNEVNMAYRMSDHLRRQQLPFVTGIEVHLSASHPRLDMCDDLVGKYPKGFIFLTWHVGCICYTTSIMLNNKDSLKFMKTGKIDKSKYITKIPKKAKNWIKINAKTIKGYKNTPYFLADNFDADFKLKDSVIEVTMPKFEAVKPGVPLFTPTKGDMQLRKIEEFNQKYGSAKTEHMVVVGPDGEVLITKSGTKRAINFTQEEMNIMFNSKKKSIFIHNHPSSTSFSAPDVAMNMAIGPNKEARVIGYKYEYSMVITDKSRMPITRRYLLEAWNAKNAELMPKYSNMYTMEKKKLLSRGISEIESSKVIADTVGQLHTNEVMEYLAKKYNFEYKRWLR